MQHKKRRGSISATWQVIAAVIGGIILLVVGLVSLLLVSIDHYYTGVAKQYGNVGSTVRDQSHWGIAKMVYGTYWYENAHSCRLSPTACKHSNKPPCRSQAWLAAHHRGQLTRVGGLNLFPNDFRSVYAVQGTSHDARPDALYVANGTCKLEYLPAQPPA